MQDYLAMVHYQCGTCYICGEKETKVDPRSGRVHMLAVDHCHKTGKVRGLLCAKHNMAIGLLGDDAELIYRSIDYIKGNAQPLGFWVDEIARKFGPEKTIIYFHNPGFLYTNKPSLPGEPS